MTVWPFLPSAPLERFTVHDSTAEIVAAIVDPERPWVIRENGKYRTIVARFATEVEAECAALARNHAAVGRTAFLFAQRARGFLELGN